MRRSRPDAPWPELREHLRARLLPIERYDPADPDVRSDFDLNPGWSPSTGATPRAAAVLVPIVEYPEGPKVLLTLRSEALKQHAGQVAFPGGRSDPGETPWQAALREAEEEIGLEPRFVEIAGLSTSYLTGTGFRVTPVVGFVRPDFELRLNPHEVTEAFEVDFRRLIAPESYERRSYRMPTGAERHFYAMPFEDRLIWGATAGMLRALHDRLFEEAA